MGLGMRWGCCFGFVLAAMLAGGVARAQSGSTCEMFRQSRLPVHVDHGRWLIDVTINGEPAQLMFDTGAFTSLLSTRAMARLHVNMVPTDMEIEGFGGRSPAGIVRAQSVEFGGLKARRFLFATADLGELDGLMSSDMVSKFDIDLDMPEKQLLLYGVFGDCRRPQAALGGDLYQVPLDPFDRDKTLVINVGVAGRGFKALIDTGSNSTSITRGMALSLGINLADVRAHPTGTVHGVGPNPVKALRYVLPGLDVGDLTFNHFPVEIIDAFTPQKFDMVLGTDFMTKVHVWISYSSRTLILQYPPLPSPKAPD
jgi:predicted aspartyl protease